LSRRPTKRPEVFQAIRENKKLPQKCDKKRATKKSGIMSGAAKCSACVASLVEEKRGRDCGPEE